MHTLPTSVPIQQQIVLVGAGNAHLVFVRRWRTRPLPGVTVTLVNEAPTVPYSAMVAAHIASDYQCDEITIDLERLCRSAGVRLVADRVTGLNPPARHMIIANRPSLAYNVLSLGLGSVPSDLTNSTDTGFALTLRPLAALLKCLTGIDVELSARPRPFHFIVVGGGASGCELSLAVHARLGHHPEFRMTLLQGNARLLPQFPAKSAAAFEEAFRSRGITWRVDSRVIGGTPGELILANGERRTCDAVLWATPGSPPGLIRASGLRTDERGFLRVRETLQAESDAAIFGAGDCVSFATYPDLARSGVHAVRQGAVLYDNVTAFLREQPLRPFRPRRRCLYLLNAGDGTAVLNYGSIAWKARWVRRLKDRIDRRWVTSFLPPGPRGGSNATISAEAAQRGEQ